ncbi:MAG: 26S proteasome non-ATPase regulatory subunit 9, partial [Paramarteilia canceri]
MRQDFHLKTMITQASDYRRELEETMTELKVHIYNLEEKNNVVMDFGLISGNIINQFESIGYDEANVLLQKFEKDFQSVSDQIERAKKQIKTLFKDDYISVDNRIVPNNLEPFLTVVRVIPSSAADIAGLESGDKITTFAFVNSSNFDCHDDLHEIVSLNHRLALKFCFIRGDDNKQLYVEPTHWNNDRKLGLVAKDLSG